MTVSDLLPFIKTLSSFRKWVEEHRQDKPLKVAQPEFLTVPPCTGGRGSLLSNARLSAVKGS